MKTLIVVGFATLIAGPALAQPYPDGQYAPPAQQPYAQQPYAQPYGQQPYDPNQDYDDEDQYGYDAQYDVTYDDQAAQAYDDGYDPQAYVQFESSLSPYGSWIDDASYGHVWIPSTTYVGYDFQPYSSGGHWVLTEYGWTWVSDWDWGWAPFHYGRWAVCGGYGWAWIPGSVWGPAWVSWRTGGGYVGWAPLPPRGVTIGPPIGVRTPWRFVVASQLGQARMSYLPAHTIPTIFGRTTVVSNVRTASVGATTLRYNAGPNLAVAGGVGLSTPARLAAVAPHAIPRATITPRTGIDVASRPWVRAGVTQQVAPFQQRPASIPIGPQHPVAPVYHPPMNQPVYHPPVNQPVHPMAPVRPTAPAYRPMPHAYTPPAYQRPAYSAPAYSAPYRAPAYSAPAYHAPTYAAPHYSAPAYHAPAYAAPHYSAPSYSAPHYSAPSYSAPHYSAPSFGGGGSSFHSSGSSFGRSGGFGGGGRHR